MVIGEPASVYGMGSDHGPASGIDDPYEPPEKPELRLDAAGKSPEALADEVINYLRNTGKIPSEPA